MNNLDFMFRPQLTPNEMLQLGVFGGAYFSGVRTTLPNALFVKAKVSDKYDAKLNCFKVRSGDSLAVWQEKGWIHPQDHLGWFEWYCHYYYGRRTDDDARQIRRWAAYGPRFSHVVEIHGNGDQKIKQRTRQSLLHWAYDPMPDLMTEESVFLKIKEHAL